MIISFNANIQKNDFKKYTTKAASKTRSLQYDLFSFSSNPSEADRLNKLGHEKFKSVNKIVQDIIKGTGFDYFRIKEPVSISDKLKKKGYLDDLIGYTITLDQPQSQNIDKIINKVILYKQNNKIKVNKVKDFISEDVNSYLSDNQVKKLKDAGIKVQFEDYKNGYVSTLFRFEIDDTPVELQMRGKHIDKLHNIEHLFYDIEENKTILKYDKKTNKRLEKVLNAYNSLGDDKTEFKNYIKDYYKYYRNLEENKDNLTKPKLPSVAEEALSVENMEDIYMLIKKNKS